MIGVWQFIEVAATVFEFFVTINFLNHVMGCRYSGNKKILLSITFIALLTLYISIVNRVYVFEGWLSLITIMITIIYAFIALNGSVVLKIVLPILSFSIMLLINTLVTYGLSIIFGMPGTFIFSENNSTRLLAIFLTKFLYFMSAKMLEHLFMKKTFNLKSRESYISVIMTFVTFFIAVSLVKLQIETHSRNILFGMCAICLMMMNIFIIYMMKRISKDNQNKLKISLLKLQISEQKTMMEDAGHISNEIKRVEHDFKHHLLCVLGNIENGDIESAQSYLRRLLCEYETNIFNYISVDNSAVNSILNLKIGRCRANGIDIKVEVESDFSYFNEIDLCVLLANLLDNAIEASENVNAPQIKVTIKNEKNYLCIMIKNKIEHSVLDKNEHLRTTKADKTRHGLGLYSISQIVEKYDGIKNYYEKNGFFTADIWLKRGELPNST